MNEVFFLVEEAIEGGYNARAMGEAIFTQGDNLDDLKLIFGMLFNAILMIITFLKLFDFTWLKKK